jgi:uncharacterized membrane protein
MEGISNVIIGIFVVLICYGAAMLLDFIFGRRSYQSSAVDSALEECVGISARDKKRK